MKPSRVRVFQAHGLRAGFGDKTILNGIDFYLAERSLCAIVGPEGGGKSVLLRTLSGGNQANPRFHWEGGMVCRGQAWTVQDAPSLVQLTARTLMLPCKEALIEQARRWGGRSAAEWMQWCEQFVEEMGFPELRQHWDTPVLDVTPVLQRAVAILREAAAEPALLLVDDLGTELTDYDTYLLLDLLRKLSKRMGVLVVLRDPRHLRFAAHDVAVIADGVVQEVRRVDDFLCDSQSDAGRQFLQQSDDQQAGRMPEPQAALLAIPEADVEMEPVSDAADSEQTLASASGMHWVVDGQLGSMPTPAANGLLTQALSELHDQGVRCIVSLTETPLPASALDVVGLLGLHLPVHPGEHPTVAQIQMLLKRIELLMQRQGPVLLHSETGWGRAGVVLAAWLVREGLTASEALRRLRLHDARYVQTPQQEQFLDVYEEAILRRIA